MHILSIIRCRTDLRLVVVVVLLFIVMIPTILQDSMGLRTTVAVLVPDSVDNGASLPLPPPLPLSLHQPGGDMENTTTSDPLPGDGWCKNVANTPNCTTHVPCRYEDEVDLRVIVIVYDR